MLTQEVLLLGVILVERLEVDILVQLLERLVVDILVELLEVDILEAHLVVVIQEVLQEELLGVGIQVGLLEEDIQVELLSSLELPEVDIGQVPHLVECHQEDIKVVTQEHRAATRWVGDDLQLILR